MRVLCMERVALGEVRGKSDMMGVEFGVKLRFLGRELGGFGCKGGEGDTLRGVSGFE